VALKDLAQLILAAVLGGITVYIAWQQRLIAQRQARTNQNQFRLHFFDRRFAVYDAVMEFSAHIAGKGSITQEELREYVKKMREASFFFDDEIQAYCNEVAKNGVNLMIAYNVMEAPDSPSYTEMVKTYGELMKWFVEQVDKGAKPRFEPFLQIRE
jgi:hypothetical protein